LSCDPGHVEVGHQTNCKAVVTGGKNAPTGTVAFSSSGHGSFGTVSCNGSGNGGDNANAVGGNDDNGNSLKCSVKYTPAQAGSQTIAGTYSGDTSYSGSIGTFLLNAANEGDQLVGLAVKSADHSANANSWYYDPL
jgi:hypothetical protein